MGGIDVESEDVVAFGAYKGRVVVVEGSEDLGAGREGGVRRAAPEDETAVDCSSEVFEEAAECLIMACGGAGIETGEASDGISDIGAASHVCI